MRSATFSIAASLALSLAMAGCVEETALPSLADYQGCQLTFPDGTPVECVDKTYRLTPGEYTSVLDWPCSNEGGDDHNQFTLHSGWGGTSYAIAYSVNLPNVTGIRVDVSSDDNLVTFLHETSQQSGFLTFSLPAPPRSIAARAYSERGLLTFDDGASYPARAVWTQYDNPGGDQQAWLLHQFDLGDAYVHVQFVSSFQFQDSSTYFDTGGEVVGDGFTIRVEHLDTGGTLWGTGGPIC